MRLKEIAAKLNGKLIGDAELEIIKTVSASSQEEHALTFAIDKRYFSLIAEGKKRAVIVDPQLYEKIGLEKKRLNYIIVQDAALEFYKIHNFLNQAEDIIPHIHNDAIVAKSAVLASDVYVGANVYISDNVQIAEKVVLRGNIYLGKNVRIGAQTVIEPNCAIYADTAIGQKVKIHSGTVIGSDGFRFLTFTERPEKIVHSGNVLIEDNVEIGANCTIDRATFDSTILRSFVKLDNLVHIGHNCIVAENTLIAAGATLSGSARIGKGVWIGPGAVVSSDLTMEDGAKINIGAVVIDNVGPGASYSGFFARPHRQMLKFISALKKIVAK